MRERILAVIEKNSRISVKELADLLGKMKLRSRRRSPKWKMNISSAVTIP